MRRCRWLAGLDWSVRAALHQIAAAAAAAGPELDQIIRASDHRRVVLDHDHGVAEIAQMAQHREQPARVARVQSYRRLIERVERAR